MGLVVLALVATSCGRSGSSGKEESASTSTSTTEAAAKGDFGTLKSVCGPGDAKGATERGVTDTSITVGTIADPTNVFSPGLGQEFFDVGKAFSEWCNAAGGINGRDIVFKEHDSKILEVGARVVDACQTDFMLVASGTPLDAGGVQPRLDCKLGQIASYVVSPQAVAAGLQVLPIGIPLKESYAGIYRLAVAQYPEEMKHVAYLGSNLPDLVAVSKRNKEALEQAGATVVDVIDAPNPVDNWRPYVEQMRQKGVQVLATSLGGLEPLMQAATEAGLDLKLILSEQSQYADLTRQVATKVALPPMYIQMNAWPPELADKNPAVKQAVELFHTVHPGFVGFSYLNALDAWLLFATAAKACGSDLTTACVLAKAGGEHAWTAGGLFGPKDMDPANMHTAECVAILKLDKTGFSYDKTFTQPNEGIFNCDPKNVAHLSSDYLNG